VPASAAITSFGTTGQRVDVVAVEQAPPPAAPVGDRLRLDIHPTAPTWVEATADGTRVLGELIDVGQSRVVEADREIVLRIGDAAAFAYSINGMPGRSLGGPGQVRDIRIIRDNVADFLMP